MNSPAIHPLDATDPLAGYRDRFIPTGPDVVAYFDGNSLGRPLRRAHEDLTTFVEGTWATRLIRGWTDDWMQWPHLLGDALGRAALGAATNQVIIGDSTSVLLYKLARAAVDRMAPRNEIVIDTDNFPTDRYILEGVAQERGLTVRWIASDPGSGVTADQVAQVVGPNTALVVLSHVAYRSAFIADMESITGMVHDAGALMLWDLSHSVGSVPVELDACGVDLAVGCTYKYVNGGPGAPAFAYVRAGLVDEIVQPIWGWIGRNDSFAMGQGYEPAAGIRRLLSGTPPIVSMIAVRTGIELIAEAGIERIREKSIALTSATIEAVDAWPAHLWLQVASPRDPSARGGHVTLRHPKARELNDQLWAAGVLTDYRAPDGIRIGLAPLSTSFGELDAGLAVLRELASK